MGAIDLQPVIGNVAFGSGKDCWGFTLGQFAEIYSKKFGIKKDKMINKLWGDNFFDKKKNLWRSSPKGDNGEVIPRAFCLFIMDPIINIAKACLTNDDKTVTKMLKILNIKLS